MSRMFNSPHPGEILKEDVLPDLGLTVTEAAKQLGVTRVTFSKIINGKSGISPDMALRLAQWLGTTPDSWLNMQIAYDLWQAEQRPHPVISAARIQQDIGVSIKQLDAGESIPLAEVMEGVRSKYE